MSERQRVGYCVWWRYYGAPPPSASRRTEPGSDLSLRDPRKRRGASCAWQYSVAAARGYLDSFEWCEGSCPGDLVDGRQRSLATYFPHISNGISGEFPGRVLSLSGASAPV